MGSAHAQDRPAIAVSNNYQAYAAAIDPINDGKARQCSSKTDALKAMAAKCASDICLALSLTRWSVPVGSKVDRSR